MARNSFEQLAGELGRVLRGRRLEKALSQEQLAHEAGLSVRHYYLIEAGRANPTLRTLHYIAAALEVSISDLIGHPARGRRPPRA